MLNREVEGNLINLAKEGEFDVIVHGCNCMCKMGAGLAPQMKKAFGVNNLPLEHWKYKGDINKLGQIEYKAIQLRGEATEWKVGIYNKILVTKSLYVVNAYTQYNYGKNHEDGDERPVDYDAIALCFKKINKVFKGMRVGIPLIGCGLAGGSIAAMRALANRHITDCELTIVHYDGTKTKY
jgi:O-acetyl-ADP-ribose deacetylase (regulator of RNase III)